MRKICGRENISLKAWWVMIGMAWTWGNVPSAANLAFAARIISEGTCTITADPSSPLFLPDIDGQRLINHNYTLSDETRFVWRFNGCPRLGGAVAPAVTVFGDILQPAANPFISKTSGSSAGYGISLKGRENGVFQAADLYSFDGNQSQATFTTLPSGPIPEGFELPVFAVVSCGSAAQCSAVNLKPGELSSTITFNFFYK
ncbi:hypothetical protein ACGVWS_10980 [Enterobacteriaceae bacterium LUAb1]